MTCLVAYKQTEVIFATDCSELVKMVSAPMEWSAFAIHLEELTSSKALFTSFSLHYIPRSRNSKADLLACNAHLQSHDIFFIDYVPPVWISEPFSLFLNIIYTYMYTHIHIHVYVHIHI